MPKKKIRRKRDVLKAVMQRGAHVEQQRDSALRMLAVLVRRLDETGDGVVVTDDEMVAGGNHRIVLAPANPGVCLSLEPVTDGDIRPRVTQEQ